MGKYGRTFGIAAALVPLMCACGMDAAKDLVAAMAATNHLETWEGRYSFSCLIPLGHVGSSNVLYGCLYRCDSRNAATLWHEGTLLEAYAVSTGHVSRVMAADTDIKGVTPVLLEAAVLTNGPSASYGFMWRHPGNGGFMRCTEYVYTNQAMRQIGRWEYVGNRNDKHWHWAVDDDTLIQTNFTWQPLETIWRNEDTLYRINSYP